MRKVRNRSTRLYSVPVYTNDGLKYSRYSLKNMQKNQKENEK